MNNYITLGITEIRDPFNELTVPLEIGNGVWLEPIEKWFDILKLESLFCPDALPDIKRRKYVYTYYSPDDDELKSLEMLTVASLSMWLAKPTDVGFENVVIAKYLEEWERERTCQFTPIINSDISDDIYLTDYDLKIAKGINEIIFKDVMNQDIKKINSVRIALWSLFKSLTTDLYSIPIRFLIIWLAIEALFGPSDGVNIKENISKRVSKFLNDRDDNKYDEIYQKCRTGYKWRSDIVHGTLIGSDRFKSNEFIDIFKFSEVSIRESLRKILHDGDLVRIFCSEGKEEYLENL